MAWLPDNDAIGSVRSIKGLRDLWAETTGDPRVTIAVLDGPVDRTHPALAGTDLTTVKVTVPAVPRPGGSATRHGTLVASLIFGRHESESPVAGIAPGCRGIVVPIFSDVAGRPLPRNPKRDVCLTCLPTRPAESRTRTMAVHTRSRCGLGD